MCRTRTGAACDAREYCADLHRAVQTEKGMGAGGEVRGFAMSIVDDSDTPFLSQWHVYTKVCHLHVHRILV